MVFPDVRLEMALGDEGSAFALPKFSEAFGGGTWADITTECRTVAPIVLSYGIFSDDPTELLAGAGTVSFGLNNASTNAAGILGWYSPLNAIKRGGFDFNIPVRLIIGDGVTDYYKFYGHLADIIVIPGVHGEQIVYCTAVDLMDDFAHMPAPSLPVQFDKRGDELVQQILDALPSEAQPGARSIETGLETYPFALDRMTGESMTVREAIFDICASEMSVAGFIGSTASGGLFVFQNRHAPITAPTVLHHFEDDILSDGLVVPGSRDALVSRVEVSIHPTKQDAVPTVLYSLETSSVLIAAGQTNDSIFGPYRDPDNPSDRVGARDMIQPSIAFDDYRMNTEPDESGVGLTPTTTVVADFSSGTGVRFAITNGGAQPGYVTRLQVRGTGIYRRTAVVGRDVTGVAFGNNTRSIEMPYLNDANTGQDVADYLAHVFSRTLDRVTSVSFFANRSTTLLAKMLVGEPGHRVAVTEAVTGLDAEEFLITGVRLELKQVLGGIGVWTTWYLKPADMGRYWFLGVAGASELGTTTTLGY